MCATRNGERSMQVRQEAPITMKLWAHVTNNRVNRNGDSYSQDAIKKIVSKHPKFYHYDEQRGRLTVSLEIPNSDKECVKCNEVCT